MSRALDALVAERIVGECVHWWDSVCIDQWEQEWQHTCSRCSEVRTTHYPELHPRSGLVPAYSTDMNRALEAAKGGSVDLCQMAAGGWEARVLMAGNAEHANPATALCIALLRAAGVDESEITAAMEDA